MIRPIESQSFRARLTLQWVLVFGVLLAASLLGVYFGLRRSLYHSLETSLHTLAGTEIASSMDGPTVHLHPIQTRAIVNSHHLEKYVQILTPDYAVLHQSTQLKSAQPLISREAMETALRGKATVSSVDLDGLDGLAISADASGKYVFVVAVPVSEIDEALATLRGILLLVGLVMLVATALVGYWLATVALRPVDLMTQRARLIGNSQLRARLGESVRDDELGRLARVLNEMLDRLYAIIESQRSFSANASHELRSPLTALRGRLEVSLRKPREAQEYRQVIEDSLGEVDHLTTLADDLLDLTRAETTGLALEPAETLVAPLVEDEVQKLAPLAVQKGVSVSSYVAADLSLIADGMRLRRVLHNLISNAISYSRSEGGEVRISAGQDVEGGWIRIDDNGIGLSDEEKGKVFQRFWRGEQARQSQRRGAGLGLAISQEIVRAHGGRIEVHSQPGLGSSFILKFPSQIEPN